MKRNHKHEEGMVLMASTSVSKTEGPGSNPGVFAIFRAVLGDPGAAVLTKAALGVPGAVRTLSLHSRNRRAGLGWAVHAARRALGPS